MTIKIEIIKTRIGWNYRNSESGKLVATVNEGRNKPDVYLWECPNDHGWANEKQAHYELQQTLSQRAYDLGEEIEFVNI